MSTRKASCERPPAAGAAAARLAAVALCAAGFALTLRVFWPGIRSADAGYVYDASKTGRLGDWQSPVMSVIWAWIDPVAPGAGSMLLLNATLYWGAFALIASATARWSPRSALLLPVLALSPPAFVFVGVIWRDMLFAVLWLTAAAAALTAAAPRRPRAIVLQATALVLVAVGVLLRPNAVAAAPLLAAYALWPGRFVWRRTALLLVPAMLGFVLLVPAVYYQLLDAKRQHPLHSLLVFDLGGITHYSKQNQFPVAWTPEQARLLADGCYRPAPWDLYWHLEPCRFVMQRLEAEGIFGNPALRRAWVAAVAAQPLAYLRHRAAHFWQLLAGTNATLPLEDLTPEQRRAYAADPWFAALLAAHDALYLTPLFRTGTWALLALLLGAAAWPIRQAPAGAFALALGGSALVYVMTYAAVGVAADFRYGYWAVLAVLAGWPVVVAGRLTRQPCGRA